MLIVDAGPLYAAAASRDKNHERSVELLLAAPRPLLVPALVVTEVSYLLGDRIGPQAEVAFARSLADGELMAEPVLDSDWARIAELVAQYVDLPLGIVDASVVALAERRGLDVIATLDQRHFRAVRPKHVVAFTLVP
ncbi:MAG TPA: PIN domain-containing protein [Solirubrobacteraceae bacterium]|nr:PIN domain-containing protein [Solirubrobacteraceae bacterium]